MNIRLARRSLLLLPLASLVIGPAPSADAVAAGGIALLGAMQTGPGISHPCIDHVREQPPSVQPDVQKCSGPLSVTPNMAGVWFGATGAGTVATGGKSKCGALPSCVEAATFSMTASGIIRGACGLAEGILEGTIVPTISLGTKMKARGFTMVFYDVGGLRVLRGTTGKGETLIGAVVAVMSGGTCLNKDPKTYTIVGTIALVARSGLPPAPGC